MVTAQQFRDQLEDALNTYHPGWDIRRRAEWSVEHAAEWEQNRQFDVWVDTLKRWVRGDNFPRPTKFADFLDKTDFPGELRQTLHQIYHEVRQQKLSGTLRTTRIIGKPPVSPPGFIGRKVELEQLKTLLTSDEARIVSIVGRRGIGKTALAVEACQQLAKTNIFDVIAFNTNPPAGGHRLVMVDSANFLTEIPGDAKILATFPVENGYQLPLEGFSTAESIDYLRLLSFDETDTGETEQLVSVARELGGNPCLLTCFVSLYEQKPLASIDEVLQKMAELPDVQVLVPAQDWVRIAALMADAALGDIRSMTKRPQAFLLTAFERRVICQSMSPQQRQTFHQQIADYYAEVAQAPQLWQELPDDAMPYFRYLHHLLDAGQVDRVAAALKQHRLQAVPQALYDLVTRLPESPDGQLLKAELAIRLGISPDLEWLESSSLHAAYYYRGKYYQQAGLEQKARKLYRAASTHGGSRLALALMDNDEAAIRSLLHQARESGDRGMIIQSIYTLAGYLHATAHLSEALQLNQEALELQPELYEQLQLWLQRALILKDVGAFDVAQNLVEAVIVRNHGFALGELEQLLDELDAYQSPNPVKAISEKDTVYPQLAVREDEKWSYHDQRTWPIYQHRHHISNALNYLGQGQFGEAIEAFNQALDAAETILLVAPDLYEARYTRGHAFLGLALRAAENDRLTALVHAHDAYHDAVQFCDAPGVVAQQRSKIVLLAPFDDGELLEPILRILEP